jgi:RecA-family ATPase
LGGEPSSSATKPGRFFGSPWDKKGGIKDPSAGPDWGLDELVATFRAGETVHPEYAVPISFRETIEKVRAGGEEGKKAKSTLPYVCVSGTFKKRSKRSLMAHSGLLQGDLDPDDKGAWTEEDQRKLMDALDRECDYARSLAKGPSGCGAKLIFFRPDLVGLTGDEALAGHDEFFRAVEAYMNAVFGDRFAVSFDKQCRDVSRAFYATWDPDLIDRREKAKPIDAEFITKWIATPITPTQDPEPRRDAAAVAVHDSAPHRPAPRTTGAGGDESPFKALEALPDTPSRVISLLCQHGLEPDGRDGSGQDAGASLKRPASMSSTGDSAEGSKSVKVFDGSGWALFRSAGAADYFTGRVASSSVMKNPDGHTMISSGGLILALEFGGDWSAFMADLEKRTGRTFGKASGAEWYGKERPAAAGEQQTPERSLSEDEVSRKVVVAYLQRPDLLDLHPLDDPGFLQFADLRVVYRALLAEGREGKPQVNREVFLANLTKGGELKELTVEEVRGWFAEEVEFDGVEEWVAYLRREFYAAQEEEVRKKAMEALANGDTAKSQDLIEQAVRMQGKAKGWDPFDRDEEWIDPALEESEKGWVVRDLLQRRNVSVVTAKSKRGKSAFVQTLLGDIARGQEVMGRETYSCRSLLVDNENQSWTLARRIRALQSDKHKRWPRKHMITTLRLRDPRNRDLCDFDQLRLRLRAECKRNDYGVVVIDPLYSILDAAGVDTNSAADVLPYLTKLQRFADDCNVHLLIVAHNKKGDDVGIDLMDAVAGTGAFGRIVEVQIAITHHKRKDHYNVKIGGRSIPEETTVWEVDFPAWHHRPDIEPAFRRQGEEQKEDEELDTLEAYVLTHKRGISAKEVAEKYKDGALTKKTVERKLDQLVPRGRIEPKIVPLRSGGGGREKVYLPVEPDSSDSW